MLKTGSLLIVGLLAASLSHGEVPSSPTAEELLKEADRARGAAGEGISWHITLETKGEEDNSVKQFLVKANEVDALAETLAPPRAKGEMLLFNERNLWFFKVGLKKPVSISPRQRLLGQAANGDIASTNYYRDYDGKIVGEELVQQTPAWKLELKAKAKNVTYDSIRYWIAKKERVGIKAEFLTVSGEVFKEASFAYGNAIKAAGKEYPFISTMIITDRLNANKQTTLRYEQPKIGPQPASLFNINNLLR